MINVHYTEQGQYGNRTHITQEDRGTVPTDVLRNMPGYEGEVPGDHRNRKGDAWDSFKDDIATNGIVNPVFVTVGLKEGAAGPVISEGNHRRDAAVELGMDEVPVQVRYFGHAERDDTTFAPYRSPHRTVKPGR